MIPHWTKRSILSTLCEDYEDLYLIYYPDGFRMFFRINYN